MSNPNDAVPIARDFRDGRPHRLRFDGGSIASVEPLPPDTQTDLYFAPAFWDIQFNGRWGWSFSDESLTVDQVREICRAQAALGSARVCPTLITASPEGTLHGVSTIARAIELDPLVDHLVVGIHLEGPWISEVDGYRGAHPRSAVRDPDLTEYRTWHDAAKGRIAIVTLAPERAGSIAMIRELTARGVVVAIAHSAADGPTIRAAVEAGATLSTHLGNGIVSVLPRHPNPIWHQAAEDGLFASFIADGHHLDPVTLKVLIRAKGMRRSILVSDFSPLAGLPVGRYGDWEVHPSGKIVVADTPYLAGSNQSLVDGVNQLLALDDETTGDRGMPGSKLDRVLRTVTANPARLLGRPEPEVVPGEPADVVLFHYRDGAIPEFELVRTYVAGRACEPGDENRHSV